MREKVIQKSEGKKEERKNEQRELIERKGENDKERQNSYDVK